MNQIQNLFSDGIVIPDPVYGVVVEIDGHIYSGCVTVKMGVAELYLDAPDEIACQLFMPICAPSLNPKGAFVIRDGRIAQWEVNIGRTDDIGDIDDEQRRQREREDAAESKL